MRRTNVYYTGKISFSFPSVHKFSGCGLTFSVGNMVRYFGKFPAAQKLGWLGRNVSHDRELIGLLAKNEICFRRQTKTEGACECRISGTHVHPLFYPLFALLY